MSQQAFGDDGTGSGEFPPPAGADGDLVEFGGLGPLGRLSQFGREPDGRRRGSDRSRRLLPLAGVALAALLVGGGVAYVAKDAGSSPRASADAALGTGTSPHSQAGRNCTTTNGATTCSFFSGPPFGRAMPGRPGSAIYLGGLGGLVHGQVVLTKPGGGYQTVDLQRGKVTAVSTTSITVRSADGYTATYVVASSTIVDAQLAGISLVKTGNQVSIQATVSGSKATASRVTDLTLLLKNGGSGFHIRLWTTFPAGSGWSSRSGGSGGSGASGG